MNTKQSYKPKFLGKLNDKLNMTTSVDLKGVKALTEEAKREGRNQDDAVEPEWDDTKRKEEIIKWFMERMENVPYGSYMDVKIALSYEKDGVFYDV